MSTQADKVLVRHKRTHRNVRWFETYTPGEKRVRIDIHDGLENYEVTDLDGNVLPDWIIHYS